MDKIYNQDCEAIRKHDELSWSRFKTTATIEAVILTGIFQFKDKLNKTEGRVLLIIGFLIILMLLLIVIRDVYIHNIIIKRIKKFEEDKTPLIDNYPEILKSRWLFIGILSLINIINLFLIFFKWKSFTGV